MLPTEWRYTRKIESNKCGLCGTVHYNALPAIEDVHFVCCGCKQICNDDHTLFTISADHIRLARFHTLGSW